MSGTTSPIRGDTVRIENIQLNVEIDLNKFSSIFEITNSKKIDLKNVTTKKQITYGEGFSILTIKNNEIILVEEEITEVRI